MDAAIPPFRPQSFGCGDPWPEPRPPNKKRKQRSTDIIEEVQEYSKSARFDQPARGSEEGSSWKNLQLILSLQDKNTDLLKYVYLFSLSIY